MEKARSKAWRGPFAGWNGEHRLKISENPEKVLS